MGLRKLPDVATNRTESMEQVVTWYNQPGDCSENRIKELKIGFGMQRMPCGQFEANAVFFRIGVCLQCGPVVCAPGAGYKLAPAPGADAALEAL